MKHLLHRLVEESRVLGLDMNIEKTKFIKIDIGTVLLSGNNLEHIESVANTGYLGALIHIKENCLQEIRRRQQMGLTAITNVINVW